MELAELGSGGRGAELHLQKASGTGRAKNSSEDRARASGAASFALLLTQCRLRGHPQWS